jgi:glycosyltransferase involved in cell wall biosynthesis
MGKSKVIVLIPCYNEAKNIESVIKNIKSKSPDVDYLIINDCSSDSTLQILKRNKYNYLDLPINLGIGGCIQSGYKYADENGYDIAIQHDGDGQHDPGYFNEVLLPIENGKADIVIGSRFIDRKGFQSTGLRRFGINFLSWLIYLTSGIRISDITSGYRAVNKKYIKFFAKEYAQDYPEPEAIMEAALRMAKILEIPVVMHERKEGKSSISSWKPLYYMIKVSIAIIIRKVFFKSGDNL